MTHSVARSDTPYPPTPRSQAMGPAEQLWAKVPLRTDTRRSKTG